MKVCLELTWKELEAIEIAMASTPATEASIGAYEEIVEAQKRLKRRGEEDR